MIFISTTFRTFSLVLMSSYLRQYAVIPILVMIIIQTIMTRWILRDTKNLADFLLSFAPYAIISLVSCPILPPSGNENEEQKRKLDKHRKEWFLYDSIATLSVYGITLAVILVIWEQTSLLQQHPNICAFDFVIQNIAIIVCGLFGLGFFHFSMCLVYFNCM